MCGKNYLVALYKERFNVIPTIDNMEHFSSLPLSEYYMVKPKQSADSIGLKKVMVENLNKEQDQNVLIQPFIDFIYEVSFYFIDANFQYALYAPNKQERWKLERYTPSEEDLQFAQRFIDWNTVTHGIQRVDGCRTADGNLLLVELEDLNPFLSIQNLDDGTKETFIENFKRSLRQVIYLPDLS